ncbi:hypothetical protein IW261DRAFT_1440993 [Armillaria novae-zelandiae]|uniref:Uncharacterized protein n=1 Tax=Armillaria novae-zelandiae TaxID=153914 RepID=A0AA39PS72_9AGAR|nr:hypothetical protein IW261DRAFT_1440993 [Armillaria novae-zelandiae]
METNKTATAAEACSALAIANSSLHLPAMLKVNSSVSLPVDISQPFSAYLGSNSKTVVRLAKENARLNALLKTTQTKLDLLERFVRFLAAFGVDPDIMERAEQAMWNASTPVMQSLGPTASSSCELAVDRHGYRVKEKEQAPEYMLNRDHLTPDQLRVVESIERLCGQASGTDLGSLEGSNTSVESAGVRLLRDSRFLADFGQTYCADADKTMVELEDRTPKKIKAPLTFALRPPAAKRNPTNFRLDPATPVKTRTPLATRTTSTILRQRSSIPTTPIQPTKRRISVKQHTRSGHLSSTPVLLTPRITTLKSSRRPKSPAIPVQRSFYKPTASSAMKSVSAGQTPRLSSQRRFLQPRKEKENIKKHVVFH